jgi:hypothetical protein
MPNFYFIILARSSTVSGRNQIEWFIHACSSLMTQNTSPRRLRFSHVVTTRSLLVFLLEDV